MLYAMRPAHEGSDSGGLPTRQERISPETALIAVTEEYIDRATGLIPRDPDPDPYDRVNSWPCLIVITARQKPRLQH